MMIYLLSRQLTHSLIDFFLLLKRVHQEETIQMFLFLCLQRGSHVILYTKIVDVCLFSNKVVDHLKSCKYKGKIGTSET